MYYVFTDGGARGNGKGVSAWAMVVYDKNEVRVGSKSEGYGKDLGYTNNFTELTAVLRALEWAKKAKVKVSIRTDSNYVKQGINVWMPKWIKNHWRTSANKPVKNVELWRPIYHLYKELGDMVEVIHVPGHATGNSFNAVGNRAADALCNVAMDEAEFQEYLDKH